MEGRVRLAAELALDAFRLREPDPVLLEALANRLVEVGELEAAVACITDPAIATSDDPEIIAATGRLLVQQSLPVLALPLLDQATRLGMHGPGHLHALGLARLQAGDLQGAEHALLACTRDAPWFGVAWRDLVRLGRQASDRNHIAVMQSALAGMPDGHPDRVPLHYALFKSFDDLGDAGQAWNELRQGMQARRMQLKWKEPDDIALFDALMQTPRPRDQAVDPHPDGPAPIFVVGLPRSGSTLLERIMGTHPEIADAGELRDFGAQLRWICEQPGPNSPDAPLVDAAENADLGLLGKRYLEHTRWHANERRFYTDKLPANSLLVGLIARSLPQARIVHVRRAPMDACFSNLKELFGEAYPHSYDQSEMARHFLRHQRLMSHWQNVFPGRIHDVSYEDLVADASGVARRIFDFCGLPQLPEGKAAPERSGAVATASSVQVREPVHDRYVGQWRRYADHLGETRSVLLDGGIEVE